MSAKKGAVLGDKPICVVLVSGGRNSLALTKYMVQEGYTVIMVSVNYNQAEVGELVEARKLANRLGLQHRVIDLQVSELEMAASPLLDKKELTFDEFTEAMQKPSNPLGIMNIILALGFSVGLRVNAEKVCVGYTAKTIGHNGLDYLLAFSRALQGPKKTGILNYPGLVLDAPFAFLGDLDVDFLDNRK